MSSTYLDRFTGSVVAAMGKQPCDAATTANITLSGYQTIDSVALTSDYMRCLVKNQTDQTKNGIYVVFSSGWIRAGDFSGTSGTVSGQLVVVTGGTQAGIWQLTTPNPVQIDQSGGQTTTASNITFATASSLIAGNILQPITANTTFYVNGSTGSDSNNGSSGAPWQTVQHAIDTCSNTYALMGANLTISVTAPLAGTVNLKDYVRAGQRDVLSDDLGMMILEGNTSSPQSCVLTQTGNGVPTLGALGIQSPWYVDGFQIQAPNGVGAFHDWKSNVSYGNIIWGACATSGIQAQYGSYIEFMRGCTQNIQGNMQQFINAAAGSIVLAQAASGAVRCNFTFSIGLTFSSVFVNSQQNGTIVDLSQANYTTSGGAATFTGAKYNIAGAAQVIGGDAYPGSVAGSINSFFGQLAISNLSGIAAATGQTISAASIVGGIITRTTQASATDATDTAANIIAALPQQIVGMTFDLKLINQMAGTWAITAGSGVAINTATTTISLAANTATILKVRMNSATTIGIY